MRFVLALIIGALIIAAGCAKQIEKPKVAPVKPVDTTQPADTNKPVVQPSQPVAPTPAEQQVVAEADQDFVSENETVEIGSMI
jgi:hypothetical protein